MDINPAIKLKGLPIGQKFACSHRVTAQSAQVTFQISQQIMPTGLSRAGAAAFNCADKSSARVESPGASRRSCGHWFHRQLGLTNCLRLARGSTNRTAAARAIRYEPKPHLPRSPDAKPAVRMINNQHRDPHQFLRRRFTWHGCTHSSGSNQAAARYSAKRSSELFQPPRCSSRAVTDSKMA